MNILLTNDDGYLCDGIKTLAKVLSSKHNIYIVAPDGERSCSSHQVNFFKPISYKDLGKIDGIQTYAVNGTPADCVAYGLKYIVKNIKIDCVISGINTVMNVGSDFLYSGTFGAAQEATFQGYPGIAVSLRTKHTNDYQYASEFTLRNLEELIKYTTKNITLNVNIPAPTIDDIKGVKVAPVAFRPYDEDVYEIIDENGEKWYQISGTPIPQVDQNNDCYLVEHNYIAITPIPMVSNDFNHLELMKEAKYQL